MSKKEQKTVVPNECHLDKKVVHLYQVISELEEKIEFLDRDRVRNAKIMNEVVVPSLPWYVRRRIQKKMNSFNEDTVVM